MILTLTTFTSEEQPVTTKIAPRSSRDDLQAALRIIAFIRQLSKSIPMDVVTTQRGVTSPTAATTPDKNLFEQAYLKLMLDQAEFDRLAADPRLFPTLIKQYMKVS